VVDLDKDIWYWYHNVSECYYHIQLTIKYRKSLFYNKTEKIVLEVIKAFKERYVIEFQAVGFDKNHVHFLYRFLPKYSGGQVIRLIKSIISREVFIQAPEIKKSLWVG
jgi:putative transposase